MQQRKHSLSYGHAAQKVHAECPLYRIETDTRRETVTLTNDARIVDKNIETAEIFLDILGGGSDGGGILKVDGEISNIAAFTLERSCCFLPECPITRT